MRVGIATATQVSADIPNVAGDATRPHFDVVERHAKARSFIRYSFL